MATITLSRPITPHNSSSNLTLDSRDSRDPTPCPSPVPNKHIPICPPGPIPREGPTTPPPSPPSEHHQVQKSLLYPPDRYRCLAMGQLAIYMLSAADIAAAVHYHAQQPLPDPSQVFPWLHGLHPSNHLQQAFVNARRRSTRKTPACLRGITIVKADGDLSVARLKGAVAPHEILMGAGVADFLDLDPKEGFSARNFHIQTAKMATTSDIIVYGADDVAVRKLAWEIAAAQMRWREEHNDPHHPLPRYNTFICVSPWSEFEMYHPELIAVNSLGNPTGRVFDFAHQERREMYEMARASEISHNVWLGPTPEHGSPDQHGYALLIECSDIGRLNPKNLEYIFGMIAKGSLKVQYQADFPSSGSLLVSNSVSGEFDAFIESLKWIMEIANLGHKVLIHCADGYTESTLLAVAYHAYSTGTPVYDSWLTLHTQLGRNMFAYPTDAFLLSFLGSRLLRESPVTASLERPIPVVYDEPAWFVQFDGSFPSRITDYMYLGNLGHANNPELLRKLGIGQILSVGESVEWSAETLREWGPENTCLIQGVQDNGMDALDEMFERCLWFIDRGRKSGKATLVHCRVGVSRSATICIAEVMRSMRLSFPRAYCFVRARRLNVIIQPNLRFTYELLKWEEKLKLKSNFGASASINGEMDCDGYGDCSGSDCSGDSDCSQEGGFKREMEWAEIAREIAALNKPYARNGA